MRKPWYAASFLELGSRLVGIDLTGKGIAASLLASSSAGRPTDEVNRWEKMGDIELYRRLSAVYAGVYATANAIAQVPLRAIRRRAGSDEDLTDSTHPLAALLTKQPNAFDTPYEIKEALFSFLELTGDAYLQLEGGRAKDGGEPEEVFLLKSHRVRPIPDSRTKVSGYEYTTDTGKEHTFSRNEIVQFTTFSPIKDWTGQGSLEAGRMAAICDLYAIAVNKNYFKNGLQSGGVVMFDDMMDEDLVIRYMDELNRKYAGPENAGKIKPVFGAQDVKAGQMSFKEMLFGELRKMNFEEIIRVQNVPPVMVGSMDGASFANAREQVRNFWQASLLPKMARARDRMNHSLAPRYGPDIYVMFDLADVEALQKDLSSMIEVATKLFDRGSMSRNEMRLLIANREWPSSLAEPLEDGDETYIGIGLLPVSDLAVEDLEPDEPADPEEEPEPDQEPDQDSLSGALQRFERMARDRLGATNVRAVIHGAITRSLAARRRQGERLFARSSRKVFGEQEAKILDRLDSIVGGASAAALIGPNGVKRVRGSKAWARDLETKALSELDAIMAELESRHASFLKATYSALAEAVGKDTMKALGLDLEFSMLAPGVQEFLKREGAQLVTNVNRETVRKLAKTLAEGVADGENVSALGDRVKSVMNQAKRQRATTIAQTETTKSLGFGSVEAYRQTGGVVEMKEWQTAGDDAVRGSSPDDDFDHYSAHGQQKGLNNAFEVSGEMLMYPGDISGGASGGNVIQCRCATLPVINAANIGQFGAQTKKEVKHAERNGR